MSKNTMDLSGPWNLKLDPNDLGHGDHWYSKELDTENTIELPGSLQAQGFGEDPSMETQWTAILKDAFFSGNKYDKYLKADDFKFPFWLQPLKVYSGKAWYEKKVKLPASFEDQVWTLELERTHWSTELWVNGERIGYEHSLSTPHIYTVNPQGKDEVRITLCVDNSKIIDLGPNSHSVSDHTQTNWNGIIGKIEAKIVEPILLDQLEVHPNVKEGKAKVLFEVNSDAENQVSLKMYAQGIGFAHRSEEIKVADLDLSKEHEFELDMGKDFKTWSPHEANCYKLKMEFTSSLGTSEYTEQFGMVQVGTEYRQFTINDQITYLRGTLDCCVFPKTGYPPTGIEEWKRIFKTCKDHGLNHIRFHSWCPPKVAFLAGDELGMVLQAECASWANSTTSLGNGEPIDKWLYEEGEKIVRSYGNHPSFLLMAYGNEPAGPSTTWIEGKYSGAAEGSDYLKTWCSYWKKRDPRRLHTSGAGWPKVDESDFHNSPEPRIYGWYDGLNSCINSKPPASNYNWQHHLEGQGNKPVLSHEIGQWCVYPNFDEVEKYTGVLKARNYEVFKGLLEEKNLFHKARDFFMASGKLQSLCYKAEIEAALRTENYGGFQLLGLNDFPGQGTALVGVLDSFWDSKDYISSKEFYNFCQDTVPLALLPKHIYSNTETLKAPLCISHFGAKDLEGLQFNWDLVDSYEKTRASGCIKTETIPTGFLQGIGQIEIDLSEIHKADQFKLKVCDHLGEYKNEWSIYVYPEQDQTVPKVTVCKEWNSEIKEKLEKGETLWLQLSPENVDTDVVIGFSSIFWNTAWTQGKVPHTLGILCDPSHKGLAQFPTDYHSDWQWWSIIKHAKAMELDRCGANFDPIIQMVPDWFDPKNLALAFEARIGKGKLLVTSIDFENNLERDYPRQQLLKSLTNYVSSNEFNPKNELKDLDKLLTYSQ